MSTYRLRPTSTQPKSNDFSRYLKATLLLVLAVGTIVLCLGTPSSQNESQRRRCGERNVRALWDELKAGEIKLNNDGKPLRLGSKKLRGILKWMSFGIMANKWRSYTNIDYTFRKWDFDTGHKNFGELKGEMTLVMMEKVNNKISTNAELAYLKEVHIMSDELTTNDDDIECCRAVFILKSIGTVRVCNREVLIPANKSAEFVRKITDWRKLVKKGSEGQFEDEFRGTEVINKCKKQGLHVKLNDAKKSVKVVFAGKKSEKIMETIKRTLSIPQTIGYGNTNMMTMLYSELTKKGITARIASLEAEIQRLTTVQESLPVQK